MQRTLWMMAVAALGLPAMAHAQARYDEPSWTQEPESDTRKPSVGVMADVGLNQYNRDLANDINTGVSYGARVDLSPQRNIGIELGYHGAVNNYDSALSSDGQLVTNAFGGDVRVNVVPATYDLPANLKPFVFGGAYYHRIDTQNFTPGVRDDINAFAVPIGAGLEADLNDRFLIGGRFTYNILLNENDALTNRDADFWTATVNVGARFSD